MADNSSQDETPRTETSRTDGIDEELSELLDSALDDFNKVAQPATEASSEVEEKEPVVEEWNEEFIRQAASQFESSLASFLGINSDGTQATTAQIHEKFQHMADAAQHVIETPMVSESSTEFAETISQTLRGLNEGGEPGNPFSEQDIMNLFGARGDQNAFVPFMQGMMQSLLSKDVLYPSLKDILEKFPDWLSKNSALLKEDEKEKYKNQIKLMEEVCAELETEKDSDTVEEKKDRFERVLKLMQKLQEYGQPPVDLVGDMGPPLPFDMQTNADPNQCSVM